MTTKKTPQTGKRRTASSNTRSVTLSPTQASPTQTPLRRSKRRKNEVFYNESHLTQVANAQATDDYATGTTRRPNKINTEFDAQLPVSDQSLHLNEAEINNSISFNDNIDGSRVHERVRRGNTSVASSATNDQVMNVEDTSDQVTNGEDANNGNTNDKNTSNGNTTETSSVVHNGSVSVATSSSNVSLSDSSVFETLNPSMSASTTLLNDNNGGNTHSRTSEGNRTNLSNGDASIVPTNDQSHRSTRTNQDEINDTSQEQHWPGPYATARTLIRERETARRAREQNSHSEETNNVSGGMNLFGSPRQSISADKSTDSMVKIPWRPIFEEDNDQYDNHGKNIEQNTTKKRVNLSRRNDVSKLSALGTDTYDILPLSALCIQVICRHASEIEAFGPLPSDLRTRLSYALCERRAMTPGIFELFSIPDDGYGGGSSGGDLIIPDCELMDSYHLTRALLPCKDLTVLSLGHCGRGFVNATAEKLGPNIAPSLKHLSLRGPYALSSNNLIDFLSHAKNLEELELTHSELLNSETIEEIVCLLPKLKQLSISSLSIQEPEEQILSSMQPPAQGKITDMTEEILAQLSRPIRHGILHRKWTGCFQHLQEVEFVHLPRLSDFSIELLVGAQLVHATSSFSRNQQDKQIPLRKLSIRHCPLISDQTIGLLACDDISMPVSYLQTSCSSAKFPKFFDTLEELHLEGLPRISDTSIEILARSPPCLTHLTLASLPAIQNESLFLTFIEAMQTFWRTKLGTMVPSSDNNNSSATVTDENDTLFGAPAKEVLQSILSTYKQDLNVKTTLQYISLARLPCVGDRTLLAIANLAGRSLTYADISWCRNICDDAVGYLVDTCSNLKQLHIWGNTQLTMRLFHGHRNETVRFIGRPDDRIPPAYEFYTCR